MTRKSRKMETKTKGIVLDTHHMIVGTASPTKEQANQHMHRWIKIIRGLSGRLPESQVWVGKIPGSMQWAVFAEPREKEEKK